MEMSTDAGEKLSAIRTAAQIEGEATDFAREFLAGTKDISYQAGTDQQITLSDFDFVKQKDSGFKPKPVSGIVNADGTPKVMYHGTKAENGDFYTFDESQAVKKGGFGFKALGKGNYFTAIKLNGTERYGSRVIAAYLDIKSPYVFDGGITFREQVSKDLGIDAEEMSHEEIQAAMRKAGYGGVIQYNKTGEIQLAVTFDSNQIKSATDNIGTFDRSNPDIRYKLGSAEKTPSRRMVGR